MYVFVVPCQRPTRKNVTKKAMAAKPFAAAGDGQRDVRAISSGLKTYVLNQFDIVMCHRLQNSRKLRDSYGRSKFSGSRRPQSRPAPMTMSV